VLGVNYRCVNCRFSFSSGWSHHAGGQFLVCTACGGHYVLGGGRSCWGAKSGEHLQLLAGGEEDLIPTGVSVVVGVPPLDAATKWDGVSLLEFDPVACPGCGALGTLAQLLEDGARCPGCREGIVKRAGTCIY